METSWSHGYFTNALYTSGFYREMAPNWLDFAALIKGHRPNRVEGEPFRYLELGSGMGLHLCLLAAAYPEGSFVGVDFHADQIAHSRQLAGQLGLTNITFVHGDLIALAAGTACGEPPLDPHARFGYVVAHGVYNWVGAPVREALLAVAAGALAIGGLFYCSYNTLPGWATASIFQHLAEHERRRSDPRDPLSPYRTTAQLLAALADPEARMPTPLARAYPGLAATVTETLNTDPHYLLHEYANAGWEPLYVDDVHPRMAAHQLRFLGSATLPELFPNLLPPAIQQAAGADHPQGPDELVIDIATNKRFRRDLFVHGFQPLSNSDLSERLGGTLLVSTTFQPLGGFRYTTTFGEIQPDAASLETVMVTLEAGPASLGVLADALDLNFYHAVSLLALMLQADQVALQRPSAAEAITSGLITSQLKLIISGAPYGFLVAPSVGSAVSTSPIEAVLLQAHQLCLNPAAWPSYLLTTLEKMGQALQPGTGETPGESGDALTLARAATSHFETEGIKKFQVRGAIPAPSK